MNCSYCIVPKVRGPQRSRPTDDIVAEVKILASQGVKEVTLLGQVVNAFGREIPRKGDVSEFVRLLQKINDIDGIVDCFGFNEITDGEFERITSKFFSNDKIIR